MTKMTDLVATYNTLADRLGVKPVSRFSDLDAGNRRIDALCARLDGLSDDDTPQVEPEVAVKQVAAALATGIAGKPSVHCRRSLDQQKGRTVPADVKAVKAPKAVKAAPAPKASATGIINRAGRIVPKANKGLRAALKAKAVAAGGSRLAPQDFASFDAFLSGFAHAPFANKGGDAILTFDVVGQAGKVVMLAIAKDGSWSVA